MGFVPIEQVEELERLMEALYFYETQKDRYRTIWAERPKDRGIIIEDLEKALKAGELLKDLNVHKLKSELEPFKLSREQLARLLAGESITIERTFLSLGGVNFHVKMELLFP